MPAMSNNVCSMVEAIGRNDMPSARKCARAVVAEDASKKNEWFCREYGKKLDPEQNPELLELPFRVKGMLQAENLDETYNEDRYLLSDRDAALVGHMARMRRVSERLEQMGVRYRNAALLHGASGTGKTMLGRHIAHEFGLPFYYLDFSRTVDSLMGKTASNVAAVFDYVRTVPCVLMLDEIDAISRRRSSGAGSGADEETNRITVTLLQEFDRLTCRQVVLAATNRIESIDPALIRRFSKVHEVLPLDKAETRLMVVRFLSSCGAPFRDEDVDGICAACEGCPPAKAIDAAMELLVQRIIDETEGEE